MDNLETQEILRDRTWTNTTNTQHIKLKIGVTQISPSKPWMNLGALE